MWKGGYFLGLISCLPLFRKDLRHRCEHCTCSTCSLHTVALFINLNCLLQIILYLAPGVSILGSLFSFDFVSFAGAHGVNHGLEIHADVIDFAKERLDNFIKESPSFDQYELCEPKYIQG